MSRLLLLAGLLFAASVSAQTTIKITVPNGQLCTYTTGPVTSASGGVLQATATAQTGLGCNNAGSGGTPSADFTYSASGLTVTFTDTSTDQGGTIGTHQWTFGDGGTSTAANPVHTYTSQNTYSVTETVTDSINSSQSSKTKSVTVVVDNGNCAVIASSTPGIANFQRLTGNISLYYFNTYRTVDITNYESVYLAAWPGEIGHTADFHIGTNQYISLKFTVPDGYWANAPVNTQGQYFINTSDFTAKVSMTLSTKCGDFSNPATNPTSSVVSGCYKNLLPSNQYLAWKKGGQCELQDNTTYYLNIINADISQVLPNGGGTASSSKDLPAAQCTSYCTAPIFDKVPNDYP